MLSRSQNKRPLDHVLPAVTGHGRTTPLLSEGSSSKAPGSGQGGPCGSQVGLSQRDGGQLLQEETGSPCWGLASAYTEPPEATDYFNQAQFVFERDVLKSKRA